MATDSLSRPVGGHRFIQTRSRSRAWRLWLAVGVVAALAFAGMKWVDGYFYPFADRDSATILVVGADEPEHGSSRSDTMLLVRVQLRPERHVAVLALPRDTRVKIPGKPGYQKLNAAYAFGQEKLLKETLAANFDIHPDYTLALLPEGMAKVVDAVGGVQMNVPMAMNYDDSCQNLHIHLKAGDQRLNGTQAVQFVRFRKDGKGDLGRMERQKSFLKTVARQSLTFTDLMRWNTIAPVLRQAVHTDLNDHQLIGLCYYLRGLQPDQLQTSMLPGKPEYLHGVSYYVASEANGSSQQVGSAMEPGWLVLNGSGRNGYARRAAHQMHRAGMTVIRTGNAPDAGAFPTSQLRVAPGTETSALASQAQKALGVTVQVITDEQVPAGVHVLVLGDDFHPAFGK